MVWSYVMTCFPSPRLHSACGSEFLSRSSLVPCSRPSDTDLGGMDELAAAAAVVAISIDDFAEEDFEQRPPCGVSAGGDAAMSIDESMWSRTRRMSSSMLLKARSGMATLRYQTHQSSNSARLRAQPYPT